MGFGSAHYLHVSAPKSFAKQMRNQGRADLQSPASSSAFRVQGPAFRLLSRRYFEHSGSLYWFICLRKGRQKRSSKLRDEWGQITCRRSHRYYHSWSDSARVTTKKGDKIAARSPVNVRCLRGTAPLRPRRKYLNFCRPRAVHPQCARARKQIEDRTIR
jgi:hypothetical protein